MEESEVAQEMGTIVPEMNRGQARALSKVAPDDREEVVIRASEGNSGSHSVLSRGHDIGNAINTCNEPHGTESSASGFH